MHTKQFCCLLICEYRYSFNLRTVGDSNYSVGTSLNTKKMVNILWYECKQGWLCVISIFVCITAECVELLQLLLTIK